MNDMKFFTPSKQEAVEQIAGMWGSGIMSSQLQNEMAGEYLAQQGRGGDDSIAHVTSGEMLIPPEVMERFPELQSAIRSAFESMGADPNEFVVGNYAQKINPITGQPEFFFKKIFRSIRKVLGKVMSNPITAAIATVATGGMLGAALPVLGTIGSSALAAGGLSLASGQKLGQALLSAGTAGLSAGAGGVIGNSIVKAGGGTTLGSIANKIGLGGIASDALWAATDTAANGLTAGGLGKTLLGGLLDTNLSSYASAIAQSAGTAASQPQQVYSTLSSNVPATLNAGNSVGNNAIQSNSGTVNQGAGAVPYSPAAVDSLSSSGVSFLNPVRSRDTGEALYQNSTFSDSLRDIRRGGWGTSIFA